MKLGKNLSLLSGYGLKQIQGTGFADKSIPVERLTDPKILKGVSNTPLPALHSLSHSVWYFCDLIIA